MIWDRWDDAMDDIRDERYELNREIQELEGRLRELGVSVPPDDGALPASPDSDDATSWADRAYSEGYGELLSRRARLAKLRRALKHHEEKGPSRPHEDD